MFKKIKNININAIIIAYTFLLMLFCTNSSPLIRQLSGSDSSVFFVIGRAMTKGKIVFKELFDHKGFYLFLFNYIGALISYSSTIGIFIVETFFMSISAIMIFKICAIFQDKKINNKKISFLAMVALMLLILRKDTFEGGNLTEEYSLAFQFISMYLLLKDLYKNNASHRPLYMLVQGVIVGVVIGIRPNVAVIWLPIALLVGFDLLFIKRDIKLFFKNLIYGIFGLLTGLAPMLIYCWYYKAFDDMIFSTFGFNMLYINDGMSAIILLKRIIGTMARETQRILFVAILISALFVLYDKKFKNNNYNKLYYFTMLAAAIIAASLSGRRYGHYYEYVVPFCLPAVCEISAKVIELKPHIKYRYRYLFLIIFAATCFSSAVIPQKILSAARVYGAVGINYRSFNNAIEICNKINRERKYFSPDEKILVIGFAPAFYLNMDVTPSEKYFYIPSIPYNIFPDAIDAQINSILSCKNDVIIMTYKDDTKTIFPEANREEEIRNALNAHYELLFADDKNGVEMYGKKF